MGASSGCECRSAWGRGSLATVPTKEVHTHRLRAHTPGGQEPLLLIHRNHPAVPLSLTLLGAPVPFPGLNPRAHIPGWQVQAPPARSAANPCAHFRFLSPGLGLLGSEAHPWPAGFRTALLVLVLGRDSGPPAPLGPSLPAYE